MAATEKAILAGGCFWGVQDLIRKLDGVTSTRVGYTGGDVPKPTYRNHGTHAEAIEISFDPDRISYRGLLEFFFQIHDPTTKNRQRNDVGMSYRSAIYYVDDEQRRVAEDTIADVDASGLWPGKVVTEVEPGRAVLGGGAGAPGLPGALSQRVHLPPRPSELEAADTRAGGGIDPLSGVWHRTSRRLMGLWGSRVVLGKRGACRIASGSSRARRVALVVRSSGGRRRCHRPATRLLSTTSCPNTAMRSWRSSSTSAITTPRSRPSAGRATASGVSMSSSTTRATVSRVPLRS
jgi:peptide-methionine (S)-S-oxide reductase